MDSAEKYRLMVQQKVMQMSLSRKSAKRLVDTPFSMDYSQDTDVRKMGLGGKRGSSLTNERRSNKSRSRSNKRRKLTMIQQPASENNVDLTSTFISPDRGSFEQNMLHKHRIEPDNMCF